MNGRGPVRGTKTPGPTGGPPPPLFGLEPRGRGPGGGGVGGFFPPPRPRRGGGGWARRSRHCCCRRCGLPGRPSSGSRLLSGGLLLGRFFCRFLQRLPFPFLS